MGLRWLCSSPSHQDLSPLPSCTLEHSLPQLGTESLENLISQLLHTRPCANLVAQSQTRHCS